MSAFGTMMDDPETSRNTWKARALKAEADRDAAYLAVFNASETVFMGHGKAMPNSRFREYSAVIEAASKMGDE